MMTVKDDIEYYRDPEENTKCFDRECIHSPEGLLPDDKRSLFSQERYPVPDDGNFLIWEGVGRCKTVKDLETYLYMHGYQYSLCLTNMEFEEAQEVVSNFIARRMGYY